MGQLPYCRLWRAAVGVAKFGGISDDDIKAALHIAHSGGTKTQVVGYLQSLLKKRSRSVQFGMVGQADLTGYVCYMQPTYEGMADTFDHPRVCDVMEQDASWWGYGTKRAIRLEVEVKSKTGRQRQEQKTYQQMVERGGGIYLLVRSAEEARMKLHAALIERGISCKAD